MQLNICEDEGGGVGLRPGAEALLPICYFYSCGLSVRMSSNPFQKELVNSKGQKGTTSKPHKLCLREINLRDFPVFLLKREKEPLQLESSDKTKVPLLW